MRKRTGHIGMSDAERKERQSSIGGSDAKIIMGADSKAIEKLWMEKRGEWERPSMEDIIIAQMGNITEDFNLDLFENKTGLIVTDEQRKVVHAELPFIHSTLDGLVREKEDGPILGVVEAKFMMPFNWSVDKAVEKYWPQVQHNMLVNGQERSWLSVLTGAAQFVAIPIEADVFYQVRMLEAEQEFWECVQTGKNPSRANVTANLPSFEEMREVDMALNNEWSDLALTLLETQHIVKKNEKAEKDLKALLPDDARKAFGRGATVTRAKNNSIRVTLDKKELAKFEPKEEKPVAEKRTRRAA